MYRTVKLTALKAWLQERQYATPYHWRQRPNDEREYQLRTAVVLELAGLSAAAHSAAKLLDVGCGDGRFTAAAAQHARATGVDVSHRALMFGRTLVPNARFVRSGGERLPFASNSFDVVTILDVIEHIPDDYEAHVIGESYRVLSGEEPAPLVDEPWSADEVQERAMEAVADEIHRMLEEGVTAEPADIDACLILGAGWPFFMGGATRHLDATGVSERVFAGTFAEMRAGAPA